MSLVSISRELSKKVDAMTFAAPTAYVYNPLVYARGPHEQYLNRFGAGEGGVLLLGMNPGPFGMAQTGVPFGDVTHVRDFLGIGGRVHKPPREHPQRRVEGFHCPRSEVSGSRLWGWARSRFENAGAFFERFFIANYCPLVFMEDSGRNRTPDKLPAAERGPLFAACDQALAATVRTRRPDWVVGIGVFAEKRAREVLTDFPGRIGRILHPSPASPAANRGWAAAAETQLRALGVELPGS